MEKVFLAAKLEQPLIEIWQKFHPHTPIFEPLFPDAVLKNTVLFLSLNPSLHPRQQEPNLGSIPAQPWPMLYASKTYKDNNSVPHFKKFFEIQKQFQRPWTFLDLLYNRDSVQKNIELSFKTDSGRKFILSQAKLTLDLISEIKPKLVIVANKMVETILKDTHHSEFNFNAALDQDFVYRYNGIPFIIRESRFLGSRYWNTAKNEHRRATLYNEIKRVLEIVDRK